MKYLLYMCIVVEVLAASYWYFTSSNGYTAYQNVRNAYDGIVASIERLNEEITQLHAHNYAWHHDPLWYESYARTHLHMGYPGEIVYLLDE